MCEMNGDSNLSLIVGDQLMDGVLSSSHASPSKRETHATSCIEFDDRASCRRMKASMVNGFIVYTRTKKKKPHQRETLMENVDTKRVKGLEEPKPKDSTYYSARVLLHKSSVVESDIKKISVDEIAKRMSTSEDVTKEQPVDINVVNSNLASERYSVQGIEMDESLVEILVEGCQVVEMSSEEINVETLPEGMLDFVIENQEVRNGIGMVPSCSSRVPITRMGNFSRNHASLRQIRRLTRSKSKHNLKKFDLLDNDLGSEADPNIHEEENPPESEQNKSVLITNRPTTVKELFDTGLLEGVSVIYMGSFKSPAFGLRGVIKDGGILCSCSLCNSRQVIPPSKFEIHACRQYKRASQYICFENGRSLLDVLKLCRNSPLHSLGATIKDAISGSSIRKSFTCKRCKGLFSFSCLGQRGPLCNSCSDKVRPHGSLVSSRISRSAPACIPPPSKSQLKITRKSAVTGLVGKSYIGASASIPPRNKNRWKLKKMSTKQALISKALKHAPLSIPLQKRNQWKVTIKDQQSHKLVFEKGGLPDGTELAYYARGQKLLEGYKKGSGIFCYCCKCEVSPSQFEAHAGWSSRRKPYAYIYTSNGLSLHEWAIALSGGQKCSVDNYDLCVICASGGDLLLCDGCPRAFHKECASLSSIPQSNWHCKYCETNNERDDFVENNVNAGADGPVTGVDPIEQKTRRCIRVVKNIETETSGCVLCNAFDFCRSGFGPRTIIICDQCEKEYHIGCLRNHKIVDLKELPEGKWFCCMDCTKIHSTLQTLLLGGAEKVSDSYLEAIRIKQEETDAETTTGLDIRWRLVSGKVASPESRMLLSQVLQIFHDCFDPIINPISGYNLIPRMVYGKNMKDEDFGGMCCAVLTVNSKVVSAGLLRVFGQEVAELPLVATVIGNRRKGYFQLLFSCIEKLLSFLNVETIVLPAAEEAESIWMNKFGFNKIAPEQLTKYMKICYQMVRFKGASMLQKRVPPCQTLDTSIEPDKSSPENLPADGEN